MNTAERIDLLKRSHRHLYMDLAVNECDICWAITELSAAQELSESRYKLNETTLARIAFLEEAQTAHQSHIDELEKERDLWKAIVDINRFDKLEVVVERVRDVNSKTVGGCDYFTTSHMFHEKYLFTVKGFRSVKEWCLAPLEGK